MLLQGALSLSLSCCVQASISGDSLWDSAPCDVLGDYAPVWCAQVEAWLGPEQARRSVVLNFMGKIPSK